MSKRLVALLQVRPGEGRSVSLVVAILFFLPWAAPSARPLWRRSSTLDFGVGFLPYMYIGLGLLTFAASLSLTALLGRVSRSVSINYCHPSWP